MGARTGYPHVLYINFIFMPLPPSPPVTTVPNSYPRPYLVTVYPLSLYTSSLCYHSPCLSHRRLPTNLSLYFLSSRCPVTLSLPSLTHLYLPTLAHLSIHGGILGRDGGWPMTTDSTPSRHFLWENIFFVVFVMILNFFFQTIPEPLLL